MVAWDLMTEAEELRKKWQAALAEYETAEMNGRPAAVRAKLHAAQEKLRGLYLAQARAAVDASLAEHKK